MADKNENTVEQDLAETMVEAEVAAVSNEAPVSPGTGAAPAPARVPSGAIGEPSGDAPPVGGVPGGADAPATGADATGPVRLSPERPPSGWTPAMREKWSQLPIEFRQEITRREEATANGIAKLREQYAPAEALTKVMNEFSPYFDAIGVVDKPGQVMSVLATERALRSAPPQQKFAMLLQLADDYGVPMRHMLGQAQPQGQPQPQQVQTDPRIMAELQQMRSWRENQEVQMIGQQVAAFAANPNAEFFDDVREDMAKLIETGMAASIEDAYKQAVWMNPSTREVLVQRQQQGNRNAAIHQRQQAAGDVNMAGGHGAAPVLDEENDGSIESSLREAWNASVTNRL